MARRVLASGYHRTSRRKIDVVPDGELGVGCGGGPDCRHLFAAFFDAVATDFFSPAFGPVCVCGDRLVAVAAAPGDPAMVGLGFVESGRGLPHQTGAIRLVVAGRWWTGVCGLVAFGEPGRAGPVGGVCPECVGAGAGRAVVGQPWLAHVQPGGTFESTIFAPISEAVAPGRRCGFVTDCLAAAVADGRHGAGAAPDELVVLSSRAQKNGPPKRAIFLRGMAGRQLTASAGWRCSMAKVLAMVLRSSRRSQIRSTAPLLCRNSAR